jgi:hypothetical protein
VVGNLPEPKELMLVEGADHFFEGQLPAMQAAIRDWTARHFPAARPESAEEAQVQQRKEADR